MSRINFDNLPLSSDQARAARNYFGWPQAKAAEESGLPLHKLKRFEAGNFIPDPEFLTDLRGFFEKRGYKFEDTPQPGAKAKETGMVFPAVLLVPLRKTAVFPRETVLSRVRFITCGSL